MRIAAQKADKTTIAELNDLLQQAKESIRISDTTAFSDLDLAFHRVIWTSTNNSLAIRIGELIKSQIRLLVATTARAPGRFRGTFDEHYEVFRAIKSKNPAAAIATIRRHGHFTSRRAEFMFALITRGAQLSLILMIIIFSLALVALLRT